MAVTLNASTSTGLVQSADTSGIITLQNNGTNAVTVDSGNLQFNSGYGSVATAYGCRAWVSFNGTGTPAIRASGNVSSITDNGTGDYTVNFTTAISDANYCATLAFSRQTDATSGQIATNNSTGNDVAPTTTALRVGIFLPGTGGKDISYVNVAVFR
jgi:hypothetical protein